jgi:hypothetical protein
MVLKQSNLSCCTHWYQDLNFNFIEALILCVSILCVIMI